MSEDGSSPDPVAEAAAVISGPTYRFTMLNNMVIRYEWAEDGVFEDRASTTVINRRFKVPAFQVKDANGRLEIDTPELRLTYDKQKFSANGLTIALRSKLTLWGAQWSYGNIPESNLGGTARTLDEVDGRCDMGLGLLSRAGYSTIDDSKSMLFDGEGFVAPRRPGDRIDGYFFCYGHDFKGAMRSFYAISGQQPILPRWALGNWWSRYYRYTQDEYVALMDEFSQRSIPLSVAVIDMDWHMVDDERVPHTGWTGYTWNASLFPDPAAFGAALHQRNLKITLNDHPHAGIHCHEDAYEDMAKALDRPIADRAPIEFDPTDPAFMKAYIDVLHRGIERVACDFWWIDWQQGSGSRVPGIDPLWLLNHFHFLDNARDRAHALIFSRYAGPGSHRYPVGFSGDTVATWESLAFQPEFTATASNIGFGWWSHDLGGHMLGYRNDELVARWIQFGCFSPILRLHSSNSRWSSKEPWLYRPQAQATIEHALQFRHRLVPYLYSMNVRAATEGEPLVQPMYWAYPWRDEAYDVPNQYFFGSELVCAPIVTPTNPVTNLAAVRVWVPPAKYVDIFTGTVYDGDRYLLMHRPLHRMPVLARAGSIVPLDAASTPPNGCANPLAYEVLVVVGDDASFTLLEDPRDDADAETASGQYEPRRSPITFNQATGQLRASVHGGTWSFRFLSIFAKSMRLSIDGASAAGTVTHHSYPDIPSTLVTLPGLPKGSHDLTIDLGLNPQLDHLDHSGRLSDMLRDFQIDFAMKDKLWKIIGQEQAAGVQVASLVALGVEERVREALVEMVCADSGR